MESQVLFWLTLNHVLKLFYFPFVLFRGRRFRYTCKIETGLSSRYAKLCHVLAYLWFHNIQVLPCPFTGNEPSFDSHFFLFNFPCCFFPGLAAQSVLVFFEFFASASCKQLVFVSVDNLHDLHGKPWKTRLHFKLKDSKKIFYITSSLKRPNQNCN